MGVQDLTPQLRTRLSRVERVVGLFVSLATLLLLLGFAYYIYHTGQRKGWWKFKARYHTFVESAAGLTVGGDVRLLGFSVGRITKVEALSPEVILWTDYGNVYIEFYVLHPYQGYIWNDSKVRVAPGDFLGGRVLEVLPGGSSGDTTNLQPTYKQVDGEWRHLDEKKGEYVVDSKGYTIFAIETPAVSEQLEAVANQVQQAMPGILNLTNQLSLVLSNVASMTAEAQALLAEVRPTLANVELITGNLKDPKGSLGEWMLPTNLNSQLVATLASANETLTNATRLLASADTNVTTLTTNISETLINLANITSNLNQQVQANTNLVKGVSDLIINANDMVQGLKKHWLLRSAFKEEPEEKDEPAQRPRPAVPKAGKWR